MKKYLKVMGFSTFLIIGAQPMADEGQEHQDGMMNMQHGNGMMNMQHGNGMMNMQHGNGMMNMQHGNGMMNMRNGDMPMGEGMTMQGKAVIKRINKQQAKVTLKHGPIGENMPPMTMEFSVSDASLLEGLEKGDEVTFTMTKGMVITEISPK
jgi:Cu/Ag efflux protein CusF